jgi:DNA-3-methyladenine glycosylase II
VSATSDLPFDLAQATRTLAACDRRLARVIATAPTFRLATDQADSPYETLLRAITYQSISRAAATTIFARIRALGRDGALPTPERILALRAPTLRKAGLSAAKIAAMKDLARKTIAGIVPTLDEAWPMSDAELVERLVAVRGIGVWTVEMFLIFRLGRPDVLPVLDLGVRTGWAITYGKTELPTPRELLAFGERWRPYRTVASWYLWRACEAGQAAFRRKRARLSAGQTRSSL